MFFENTLSKNIFLRVTFKKLKNLYKKCILKRHVYNFEYFELILKISFKDTFSIILKILNLN